ncbi:MAG: DUF3795 domain-containing protein [Candidatus Thorarchaeota archaeon]|nr:MAG: DUF3795 domain-containing protein [Candidatus Thorarchaeota archaeon]
MIGKCGHNCSLCPWSRTRHERLQPGEWDSFFEEVKKYVGYSVTKNPCHGCQTPDNKLSRDVGVHNFVRGCPARKCAQLNQVRNCAYCSEYPCHEIEIMNEEITRESVAARIGEEVPDCAYQAYIEIFQGMAQLDPIRETLALEEIVQARFVERKTPKTVGFPGGVSIGKNRMVAFRTLHKMLTGIARSSFGLKDIETYAVGERLKKRRKSVQRFLWIVGRYGTIREEESDLLLNSLLYSELKKTAKELPSSESGIIGLLKIVKRHGVRGEIIPLIDNWKTPTGYLRDRAGNKPGWQIRVWLTKAAGDFEGLKALNDYAKLLTDEYGRRAFGRFCEANMSVIESA